MEHHNKWTTFRLFKLVRKNIVLYMIMMEMDMILKNQQNFWRRVTFLGALMTSSLHHAQASSDAIPLQYVNETTTRALPASDDTIMYTEAQKEQRQQSYLERIKAFKLLCDESGATTITQDILIGVAVQCALVYGWNNSLTQAGVSKVKKHLADFFIKHGINDISFINYIISTIHSTFSFGTIKPTIESSAYTSVFTNIMDLATDPVACGIWFEIFYTALTAGPTALLMPKTLLLTVASGALEGIFSLYITNLTSRALAKIRGIVSPLKTAVFRG